jgi:hypothetical protein
VPVKIRAITLGLPIDDVLEGNRLDAAVRALREIEGRFVESGYEVQTVRLATSPLAESPVVKDAASFDSAARSLDAAFAQRGIQFASIGPLRWPRLGDSRAGESAAVLAATLGSTSTISATIETGSASGVRGAPALAAGAVVATLAANTPGGLGNFRFGSIAHCGPNIPFFPAAYHEDAPATITLGLEAAGLAREALAHATEPGRAMRTIYRAGLRRVRRVGSAACAEVGVRFGGVDLTPAPFPIDELSSGAILEDLGVERVGAAGTLAAAALLTRSLRGMGLPRVGFSGLMLPVLEDSGLAAAANDGLLSWPELLLWSAVCGTGLDVVPLPGDTSAEELAAMSLDVATLATTLRKPLSCRLFPVPGKRAGEMTEYDFPYFANARVLATRGLGASRLFERVGL